MLPLLTDCLLLAITLTLVHPAERTWVPASEHMGPGACRESRMTSTKSAGLVLEREFLGPPAHSVSGADSQLNQSQGPRGGGGGGLNHALLLLWEAFCTEMSTGSKQSKQAAPTGRGLASDRPAPGGHRSSGSADPEQGAAGPKSCWTNLVKRDSGVSGVKEVGDFVLIPKIRRENQGIWKEAIKYSKSNGPSRCLTLS